MKIIISGYNNLITITHSITHSKTQSDAIIKINGVNTKYELYTNGTVFIDIKKCSNNWICIADNINYILDDKGNANKIQIIKSNIKDDLCAVVDYICGDELPDNFDNWTEKQLDEFIETNTD